MYVLKNQKTYSEKSFCIQEHIRTDSSSYK